MSDDVCQPKPPAGLGFGRSIKGRALQLLSQREHSRAELERKLQAHEATPGELAQALDELQARDFINDGRVIESVINHRSSKLGAARLKQELAAKGLSGEAVTNALASIKDSELERAHAVWLKKFGETAQDPRERAKQARFLLTRGFTSDVVNKVLR